MKSIFLLILIASLLGCVTKTVDQKNLNDFNKFHREFNHEPR